MADFDVAIVGGGHNGLIAAAYLARASRRVVVLERRPAVGGAAATDEVAPGFRASTGADVVGLLRPEIIKDLGLPALGVQFLPVDPEVFALGKDGPLRIWRDVAKTQSEIAVKSRRDAETYPRFVTLLRRFAKAIDPLVLRTPPNIAAPSRADQMGLLRRALALRRMGKASLHEFLRIPPMPVRDVLNEWFETELLKATLAVDALLGTFQGPWSPGTAFGLIRHFLAANHGPGWAFVQGGIGNLASALAQAAADAGATIRTDADVTRIRSVGGRVTGVELASGEAIRARVVASNADPKRTFLRLVDPAELSPEFLLKVRSIEMNGVVAKVVLALDGPPPIPGGGDGLPPHLRIAPSLEYIERAYDDAKYGGVSTALIADVFVPTAVDPSLAPAGKHLLSATVQYAPYSLRTGEWTTERGTLAERVIGLLDEHMPGLERRILGRTVLGPRDLEARFGMTEGHIHHGEMTLDQTLILRPVAGWARYRTPIEGLYLCGAGAHPGGGITGAPGYNAAREILKDWPRLARGS